MMLTVDLNCDMGESLHESDIDKDKSIMSHVSSVNIACGFHAGNIDVMRRTAAAAIERGVAVGAHPSYRDPDNFGRSEMVLPVEEVKEMVSEQIDLMKQVCEEFGGRMFHVKPHGALYNQAARDPELASAIVSAVMRCDPTLILYGLSGSHLVSEARRAGLRAASEVFADRTYLANGSLTPRSRPGALIENATDAVAQVLRMVKENTVAAIDGDRVAIEAETVCIHGDGPKALEFAMAISSALAAAEVSIRNPARA